MSPNFIKYSPVYFTLSALVIIPSIYSLLRYGLQPAIDFTGGSLLELNITPHQGTNLSDQLITDTISPITDISSVQFTGDTYLIRTAPLDPATNQTIQASIGQELGSVEEIRFETVGPTLGAELVKKTTIAILLAAIAILIYVAYQFKELKYGVCAVAAMFHDTLIVVGSFSILGHLYHIQVDTLFVTAVLTILSFSVHDTIVVYDRIRETLHRHSKADFASIVNKAIAETLARSVNNSMTIIFMLTSLFLLGGDSIRFFILALLIGTITGTYSSTFTAAPLLVVWETYINKKSQH